MYAAITGWTKDWRQHNRLRLIIRMLIALPCYNFVNAWWMGSYAARRLF